MDSRLRALKRAIVDTETAARYVAACVQAGENTRERVRLAACLRNPVALLLEPEPYSLRGFRWSGMHELYYWIDLAPQWLTQEERRTALRQLLAALPEKEEDNAVMRNYREALATGGETDTDVAFSAFRSFGVQNSETYDRECEIEAEVLSKVLLGL